MTIQRKIVFVPVKDGDVISFPYQVHDPIAFIPHRMLNPRFSMKRGTLVYSLPCKNGRVSTGHKPENMNA